MNQDCEGELRDEWIRQLQSINKNNISTNTQKNIYHDYILDRLGDFGKGKYIREHFIESHYFSDTFTPDDKIYNQRMIELRAMREIDSCVLI